MSGNRFGYEVLRDATLREVLESFLRTEASRPECAAQRDAIDACFAPTLDDDGFIKRVRDFATARNDVNPVLTWTIGTLQNKHHERVSRWVLAKMDIDSLFSCGINPTMKADLDAVQGNLARFSTVAHRYPEFRMGILPKGDQATIIAVARECGGRNGTIEVIDGAHRVVAMAGGRVQNTPAFLAELK
jgi:hypothetical protein